MKNEKNPPVEKGASLSENGSSVGNKMEAKILRSLMRSSKWHYCFNASCSKAQECAAFLSGKILIHDEAFYKELFYDEVVPTIRPDARYDDKTGSKISKSRMISKGSENEAGSFYPCTQFCRPCMERKVWGFSQFYAEVKYNDTLPMRHQLMSLLGGRTAYYRFHRGEKLLSAEMQACIAEVFKKWGYNAPSYDFSKEVPGINKA